jgi:drug/metabolite transporter (DMT)-like permease
MTAAFLQTQPPFTLAGEYASLGAALVWACAVTAYRYWGRDVRSQTLNLLKSLVAFVCLSISVAILRPPFPAGGRVCLELMLSGIVGLAIGDTAFFAALRRLGAQGAACGSCLSPPFSAAIAVVYLGETLSLKETAGVAVAVTALAGVLYFGRRGTTHLASLSTGAIVAGVLFVVISALANAIGLVIARNALQEADVLWGTLIRTAPALLVLAALRGLRRGRHSLRLHAASWRQVGILAVVSFWGTFVGLLLYTVGMKYAKAGLAAALTSTVPLWVVPIARILLKERMNWQCVVFTLLAVAGIALMLVPDEYLHVACAEVGHAAETAAALH